MKKLISLTLLALSISTQLCAVEENAHKSCSRIFEIKQDGSKHNVLSFYFQTIKSVFKREFVKTDYEQFDTKEEDLRNLDTGLEADNNYIFLFKPILDEDELSNDLKEHERLEKEANVLQRNLKQLVNTKNIKGCIEKYDKYPVNEDQFEKVFSKLKNNKNVNNMFAYDEAEDQIKRVATRIGLKNSWKKIKILDLATLRQKLISKQTKNIIIVAHSDPSGSLRDSYGKIIPKSIFNGISPTIQTITFFSCFGKEVKSYYDLSTYLSSTPSIHSHRFFGTISESSQQDKTPVKALGNFLKSLDSKIYNLNHARKKSLPLDTPTIKDSPICQIGIETNDSGRNFVLNINSQFIANPSHGSQVYHFPCDVLSKNNKLRLVNRSEKMLKNDVSYDLKIPFARDLQVKTYKDSNNRFDGLKIDFQFPEN